MLVVLTLAHSGATRTVVDTDIVSIKDSIQGRGRQVVLLKSGAKYVVASIKPMEAEVIGPRPVQERTVERTVVVQQRPQQGYRPASRSDSIIDTAVGIGAGIVIGDVVTDILGGLFD